MTDGEQNTGVGVFLIPEASDPIVGASSEQAHMTTIWLGDMNALDEDTIAAIRDEIAAYTATLEGPVVVPTLEQGVLGEDEASVQFLEPTESLLALRDGLLEASPTVKQVMDSVEQYPEWTPHVTLGYPDTPAAGEYAGDAVTFDRVGLWVGPDQEEFPMGAEKKPALAAGGVVIGEPVVFVDTGAPEYVIPLSAARFRLAAHLASGSLIADASSNPVDDQSDLTDAPTIDDEMPPDELEEGEEEITEIPVHGVATVEGRATGDGRGFRSGALQLGAMPQPLGYEYVSTHGGDTSNVAIVGRIDSYERKELGDGVVELRWRGVVMPGKEYGAKAIESIVDGSYTGLSVVVDSVEVDVEEEREALRQRILADRAADAGGGSDEEFDVEAMLDDIVGDGKQRVTWFNSARVRRFDMVPTGAFQEAYIALGHEFADELDADALVAAAQALEDCGCLDDVEDLSSEVVVVERTDASGTGLFGPFESRAKAEEWVAAAGDGEYGYVSVNRAVVAAALRDIPVEERKKAADKGHALPDGSFPIENVDDLKNAIQAIGRAKDPDKAKAHIKKRARELGQEGLIPEDWSIQGPDDSILAAGDRAYFGTDLAYAPADVKDRIEAWEATVPEGWDFAPGTKDGPGWITHPIPTARIRRYWVRGKGAAKIKWGVPGDFNRCRAQLAKYVQNPDWLAGLCANMHKEAIGVWPGQEGGGRHSLVAGATPAPLFSLVAAAAPVDADFFERRELENPRVGIVVDGDAVYGYLAQWNQCHVGIQDQCTLAPHSPSNYGQFRTGTVMTTRGPVAVGQLTMNTGHARGDLSARSTVAHYDNTGAAAADIACGEDRFGIWFAGRIRPNLSDDDRYALAASGRASGDWRMIGGAYELVAALVVNVPGFPIPDVSITASADMEMPISITAAGVIRPEDIDEPVDDAIVTVLPALDAETIAGIATAAAEQVLFAQQRQAIIDRTAPARAALGARLLSTARAKLAEITKE